MQSKKFVKDQRKGEKEGLTPRHDYWYKLQDYYHQGYPGLYERMI